MNRFLVTLFLTGIMGLFQMIFGQSSPDSQLTMQQFLEQLDSDSTLVVLDVRTREELSGSLGKIQNVVHIPLQELQSRMGELERYKNKPIAVICRSGNRSRTATSILRSAGYNAVNVLGGMSAYRNARPK